MSKPIKDLMTRYLKDRYRDVSAACVVDLTGMDVATTEEMRGVLREQNARMEVVKNSLARRAFADTPLAPLGDALSGPCALVYGEGDSLIEIAKLLVTFAKTHKALTLKEALRDDDPELLTVEALSRMKSRMEVLGDIAALIGGPGRRVAGAIGSAQGKIAGCLLAIAEKE